MRELVDLPKQFKVFVFGVHNSFTCPCWLIFLDLPDKDCPTKSKNKCGHKIKRKYDEILKNLSKMMEVFLQQLTELNKKEFNFLLTDYGIECAIEKWSTIGAQQFLDNIPAIGTKRLGKVYHRWVLLRKGEGQFKGVTQQLSSAAMLLPRC